MAPQPRLRLSAKTQFLPIRFGAPQETHLALSTHRRRCSDRAAPLLRGNRPADGRGRSPGLLAEVSLVPIARSASRPGQARPNTSSITEQIAWHGQKFIRAEFFHDRRRAYDRPERRSCDLLDTHHSPFRKTSVSAVREAGRATLRLVRPDTRSSVCFATSARPLSVTGCWRGAVVIAATRNRISVSLRVHRRSRCTGSTPLSGASSHPLPEVTTRAGERSDRWARDRSCMLATE